jgi:hypothetical protein
VCQSYNDHFFDFFQQIRRKINRQLWIRFEDIYDWRLWQLLKVLKERCSDGVLNRANPELREVEVKLELSQVLEDLWFLVDIEIIAQLRQLLLDDVNKNLVFSEACFWCAGLENLDDTEGGKHWTICFELIDEFLHDLVEVLVEDGGIVVDIDKIAEGENLWGNAFIDSIVNFHICLAFEIELYFACSESSHPEEDID